MTAAESSWTPRHARRADLAPAAGVLARSFADDPVMGWVFDDSATRTADLEVLFGACLAAAVNRGHTYVLSGDADCAGAALWGPPEVELMSREESAPIGDVLGARYGDPGRARMRAMAEAMAAHHPDDAHFYLWIVGVDPAHQGHGRGAWLLAPVLRACDEQGTAAYLESTNPRNIGFYRRLGFTVVSEFHPEGGPLITGMWRAPAA